MVHHNLSPGTEDWLLIVGTPFIKNIRQHEESVVESGNLGQFYRLANSKFTFKTAVATLKCADGTLTTDPTTKASILQNYYSSVYTVDINLSPSLLHHSILRQIVVHTFLGLANSLHSQNVKNQN
jgi:hypothetical protein